MILVSFLRLCRLYFSVPMALTFTLTVYYARGGRMAGWWQETWGATLALFLLISGAYVLNDVADVDFDRLAAAHRPIPAEKVQRLHAGIWGLELWMLGVITGSFLGPNRFPPVLWAVAFGLLLYDSFSKRLGIGKQITVATLMTSVYPLAISFSDGVQGSRAWTLLPFAVWMFLSSYAFELLKDIRDRHGDAEILGRRNWVQRRPRTWLDVASWLILLSGLALIAPAFLGCRWVYAAGVPALVAVSVWGSLCRHYIPKMKLLYLQYILVGALATLDVMVYGF